MLDDRMKLERKNEQQIKLREDLHQIVNGISPEE